ncbi:NADH-quinone oxidoreductase subunit M [Microlunatus phosphovorus]|uniref:NADH-quinone oxidoreductase subunit M n=1 Tax=Microlunatus phosphovorus TaxID=29405 RepID=UPI00059F36EC|nr:NADH-quinone oxidoreductase subunit M [Microlunatus phosphovorus]
MTVFPWLTVLALLPLVGAALLIFIKGSAAKSLSLAVSVLAFAVSLGVLFGFQPGGGMQFNEQVTWIKPFGVHYALGVDGIGLTLVLLVTFVTPLVILASWNDFDGGKAAWIASGNQAAPAPKYDARVFFALVLVVESLSLFVFTATDVFMFYVFFEAILLPMYFLIGGFGGARRSYAAVKFLLFGLLGGFVMLASVVGLYVLSARAGEPSYLLSDLSQLDIATGTGRWLFVGFMFAFAIKAPMVPFHTWLPDAAEESNPGGATMMVGLMDKIGTFGMIRFCLGLFPEASQWATPVVLVLAVISILYGAIAAIGSRDLMRLIAYTSISHFGFMVMGIFAFTTQSMVGSTFYMLNHGLSTALLFLIVGYFIKRRGSRDVFAFGGVQTNTPVAASLWMFAALATCSLPGLSTFVSEFMVLAGTFSRHPAFAAVATVTIVLAALYMLLMYQRTMTGPVTPEVERTVTDDLSGRERLAIAPLVILVLVLGFFPKPMLDVIEPAVQATMQHVGVSDPQPWVTAEGGR